MGAESQEPRPRGKPENEAAECLTENVKIFQEKCLFEGTEILLPESCKIKSVWDDGK